MDAKKTLKKYILPKAWNRGLGWVLAAATVVFLLLGVMALNEDTGEAQIFYPNDSETGTMAYIDVVGVSDWLYKYDDATYYSVEDAEGFLYTVRLKDKQFAEMKDQQEYWNRASESEPMPATYRLEGYVQKISSDVRSTLAECWDISTAEYDLYFGEKYLNATTSVGAENSAGWFVGALFCGIFALCIVLIAGRSQNLAKKCLRQLEERGLLEKAAQQLEFTENHIVIGKNRAILTQDFLFGRGTGAAIPYADILWAYHKEERRNFVAVNSYLMVGTRYMNPQGAIDLNKPDRKGYLGDALAVIAQRNPRALLGYTSENGKAFRAMAKQG